MNERREINLRKRVHYILDRYKINDTIPDIPKDIKEGLYITFAENLYEISTELAAMIEELENERKDTGH